MDWKTTEEMVKELGLKSSPTDRKGLDSELRERLKALHPDAAGGGDFASEEDAAAFDAVVKAIHFVRNESEPQPSSTLVPLETVTELIKSLNSSLIPKEAITESSYIRRTEERASRAVSERQLLISRSVRVPRISLAALTAILVWLVAFPNTLEDNPFVGRAADSLFFARMWWIAVLVVIWLWFLTWRREDAAKDSLALLYSLDVHREALDLLYRDGELHFSRTDLRRVLRRIVQDESRGFRYIANSRLKLEKSMARVVVSIAGLLPPQIDRAAYDEATDLAIERYLQRGWIEKAPGPTLDDWYSIKAGEEPQSSDLEPT